MTGLFVKKSDCFGCEACAAACPFGAITMEQDREGFLYPVADSAKCQSCGRCSEVCPAKHLPGKSSVRAFAVRCNDEKILYESTSGGAFSLIASAFAEGGCLVCGAEFDGEFNVVHRLSDDFSRMRKSKYAQSRTGDCFAEMKKNLSSGRQVLFSGTPCQCHAVRLMFGNDPGLIILSLLCRGAASPLFWKEYRRYIEKKDGELTAYCFRDKRFGNDAHGVSYTAGGKETAVSYFRDPFGRIYSKDIPLRPSCYSCPYCFPDRDFDFSVGDFWGIEKILPELNDGKGTSLVLTSGVKAEAIMEKIAGGAFVREVPADAVLQPALVSPAREPFLRRFFFNDLIREGPDGCCDMQLIIKKYGM